MYQHSVLQVRVFFPFVHLLLHLSGNLRLQNETAQGLRTSRGTLEGKRRHRLAYRKKRGVHVIEIQTKTSVEE